MSVSGGGYPGPIGDGGGVGYPGPGGRGRVYPTMWPLQWLGYPTPSPCEQTHAFENIKFTNLLCGR